MGSLRLILVTLVGLLFVVLVGCNNGQVSSKDAEKFYDNGAKDKSDNTDQSQKSSEKK